MSLLTSARWLMPLNWNSVLLAMAPSGVSEPSLYGTSDDTNSTGPPSRSLRPRAADLPADVRRPRPGGRAGHRHRYAGELVDGLRPGSRPAGSHGGRVRAVLQR